MASFPVFVQHDAMDCGPTCLRMIAKFYGRNYSLQNLRDRSFITKEGVSMLGISDAAESIGFRTIGVSISFEKLIADAPLPVIVHWKQNHFIVVYKIRKKRIYVADPAFGLIKYSFEEFKSAWISDKRDGEHKGVALLLQPAPEFYNKTGDKIKRRNFRFLFDYIRPYKRFLFQLFLGVVLASILQLIFPFLTQSIVDYGINNQDLDFIYLILISQLVVVISRQSIDFIRGWILLHLTTRINISLISDFLIKLMKLPLGFFDTRLIGDLLQRVGDHRRIEIFLTSASLNILLALFNIIIFSIVLVIYSIPIFLIFIAGACLYILWILIFMKKRKELDFKRFQRQSEHQSNLIQIINGIEEIKLNDAEKEKRWKWEQIQASLFNLSIKSLSLNQYQQAGAVFINEIKNIIITFIAAASVVNGNMTLGMMLAVSYILGQLNGPLEQLTVFMRTAQDAKLSLERLGEIYEKPNEETEDILTDKVQAFSGTISLNSVSFRYEGPYSPWVLKDLSLTIPEKYVTAIVGASGSGKTTLVKLLLSYYQPNKGELRIGEQSLRSLSPREWRRKCGVVLQNGYLFSDTIAKNIALGSEKIDLDRLLYAARISNINEFIESLPMGYNTRIGQEGQMLSGGEKQRILIARAVYKNPDYLFIDEGTSSLDANNEKIIMDNLESFFKGKTVIIVAHRLSTVKNADQIVVLDKGMIVETGNHQLLTEKKGHYYQLVKNQLELGT